MGAEKICTATIDGHTMTGKVHLETTLLQFRGDRKLSIPFGEMSKVTARRGVLTIVFSHGRATFQLGEAAEKWAHKILHPPSRLEKLGVKPGLRISVVEIDDDEFGDDLRRAGGNLTFGRPLAQSDVIFWGVAHERELTRFATLKRSLTPEGALWVIRPRGCPDISERAVMAAGKAAGLVDVKVARFSATHTAEKFVIPKAQRPT